jgi:hypothetical protein
VHLVLTEDELQTVALCPLLGIVRAIVETDFASF